MRVWTSWSATGPWHFANPNPAKRQGGQRSTSHSVSPVFHSLVFAVALTLSGCAAMAPAVPPIGELTEIAPRYGYRFSKLENGRYNSDGLFIVASFSGGGTRSAALAYGVLDKLRETSILWGGQPRRLLDEIDVINSVSGGSYAAAYYGLYGDAFFSDFPSEFLHADFQTELWDQYVSFTGLSQLIGWSSNDRVDRLSQILERRLFGKQTFADLVKRRQRPLIVIHATDLNRGSDFQFTQDQFDPLCNDLSSLTISRAVAASSAVPILFGPVVMKNNSGRCGYVRPSWVERAVTEVPNPTGTQRAMRRAADFDSYLDSSESTGRPWIHLIDGGISDNLGLRGPLESSAARGGLAPLLYRLGVRGVKKVVFLVVSAEVLPDRGIDRSGQAPSTVQMASAVVDALMNNNSFETMTWLRASLNLWRSEAQELAHTVDSPYAGSPDFYLIEAHLQNIADPVERNRMMHIPTALKLEEQQVQSLISAGRALLKNSPEFQRLVSDLQ